MSLKVTEKKPRHAISAVYAKQCDCVNLGSASIISLLFLHEF